MKQGMKIGLVMAAAMLLSACSKVTLENYNKLKRGMEKAEVEAIIGAPSSCSETLGVQSCMWGTEQSNITITYAGNKVLNLGHTGIN